MLCGDVTIMIPNELTSISFKVITVAGPVEDRVTDIGNIRSSPTQECGPPRLVYGSVQEKLESVWAV